MAAREQYIQLARALPTQLQRFFARYPPASILGRSATATPSPATTSGASTSSGPTTIENTSPPSVEGYAYGDGEGGSLAAAQQAPQPATAHTAYQAERADPFGWLKHPVTGRWLGPVYSARRQAQSFQLARRHGVEELLPPSDRSPAARLERRVALGLRVKGTGVGQRVKGHAHERGMEAKYVSFLVYLFSQGCTRGLLAGCHRVYYGVGCLVTSCGWPWSWVWPTVG